MLTAVLVLLVVLAAGMCVLFVRMGASARESGRLMEEELARRASEERRDSDARIAALMQPLREQMESFRRAVSDGQMREHADRRVLADQVERLMGLNRTLGDEARNLTEALTRNPKAQGNWGEIQLETLLQSAGLMRGVNYESQLARDASGSPLRDTEGNLRRPDFVLRLPDGRSVVIDSKVSLTAYVDYCSASTEAERAQAGRRHVESVRAHIDELRRKQYQQLVDGAMEHVLMFIPNEGAYLAAVALWSDLHAECYAAKVAIVAPAHLLSLAQLIAQIWREENQSRNAEEIARRAGQMYDKLAAFCTEFRKLDREIDALRRSYDDALRHLSTGRGNLISRAEKLRAMGAETTRALDSALTQQALAEDEGFAPYGLSEADGEPGTTDRN